MLCQSAAAIVRQESRTSQCKLFGTLTRSLSLLPPYLRHFHMDFSARLPLATWNIDENDGGTIVMLATQSLAAL